MPMRTDSDADRGGSGYNARYTFAKAFDFFGGEIQKAPVLLSVPHAGRDYSADVIARSRVPLTALRRLEDRYADLLITELIQQGYAAIIARIPRAVIDLNRDARDVDGRMVAALPRGRPKIQSAKQRGGLGLFPRSLPRVGELWREPIAWREAAERIERIHEPYHAAIDHRLVAVRSYFGQAMLIDVHSMPPLDARDGPRPDIIIGDRFGASASPRFAEVARAVVANQGFVVAINHPYPGYYLAERHGRPAEGRHVLQVEISRDMYLDSALEEVGPGLRSVRTMLAELVSTLADEVIRGIYPIAAE